MELWKEKYVEGKMHRFLKNVNELKMEERRYKKVTKDKRN